MMMSLQETVRYSKSSFFYPNKMDIERRLAKRVKPISVDNSRRLEDYLKQARTLKIQGSSLYNSQSYVDVTSP